ncbi:hypothetical protein SASPL_110352 [Salvia splendens]|uniref:Uncharacterized protein n=1 Tax=Salvia splendens TaxID=180675 RepID=A0A8X8YAG1_SALSN|nr:uncharacterized protein LOC121799008 [Salvia splendens]KAG6426136.1 hypothetical protein SASPL_110352 [Salvia splendens]
MDFQLDEFEYEDDVFYSELRKQVMQLTAEDEDDNIEEHVYKNKNSNTVAARKEGLNDSRGYYDWHEMAAPAFIMNLWRTGNGTGVFIPQIVQSKKKNRSRRKRNERGQTYKRAEQN